MSTQRWLLEKQSLAPLYSTALYYKSAPKPLTQGKCTPCGSCTMLHQPSEWGKKKCFWHAKRSLCGCVSQGQLLSQNSIFMSPQTQSHWNMWFWSAHVQGRGQLKHQYTVITHYAAAMRTTCQFKPKCPDPSPCFQSCLVPREPCSQASKQWLYIHSTFAVSRKAMEPLPNVFYHFTVLLDDELNRLDKGIL